MANLVIENRVREQTTATGTGNLGLGGGFGGPVSGFRAFSAAYSDGVPFPYSIKHLTLNEWEEGIGELASSGTLLVRRCLASSNSNNVVNFSAGTKELAVSRHSFIVGNECTVGTGEDGALNITTVDVDVTEDKHYTTISWGVGATGKINFKGGRLFWTDECDMTNAPAGAMNADAAAEIGCAWGTAGGGINGGVDGSAGDFLSHAAQPGAFLGGRGGSAGGVTSNGEGTQGRQIGKLGPLDRTVGIPAGGGGGSKGSAGADKGGGGAGCLEARGRRFRRTSATATGAIRAVGAAAQGTDSGGGGGGRVRLGYYELLGSSKTNLIQAPGGAGTGAGEGGDGGQIETYNLTNGTQTLTTGTANSGATPGVCNLTV